MAYEVFLEYFNKSSEVKKKALQTTNLIRSTANDEKVVELASKLTKDIELLNTLDSVMIEEIKEEQDEKYSLTYDILYYSNNRRKRSVLLKKVEKGYVVAYVDLKKKEESKTFTTEEQTEAVKAYALLLDRTMR